MSDARGISSGTRYSRRLNAFLGRGGVSLQWAKRFSSFAINSKRTERFVKPRRGEPKLFFFTLHFEYIRLVSVLFSIRWPRVRLNRETNSIQQKRRYQNILLNIYSSEAAFTFCVQKEFFQFQMCPGMLLSKFQNISIYISLWLLIDHKGQRKARTLSAEKIQNWTQSTNREVLVLMKMPWWMGEGDWFHLHWSHSLVLEEMCQIKLEWWVSKVLFHSRIILNCPHGNQ